MLGIIRLMSSDFVYLVDACDSTREDITLKSNSHLLFGGLSRLSGHVVFPENTNDEE